MTHTIFTIAAALAGAFLGSTQWLCPDGSCAMTGTWYGGAFLGAGLGLAAGGVVPLGFGRARDEQAHDGESDG